MQIQSLENTSLEDIVNCLNQAFIDYFVQMPTEVSFWADHWKGARADYKLSFGMFDHSQLVGFIIHGIDRVGNNLTAFNTGTGVIPRYQGKHIPSKLYNYANRHLVEFGVSRCRLEVIQKNEHAVYVYKKIGFEIIQRYKCFRGEIKTPEFSSVTATRVSFSDLNSVTSPAFELSSWDHMQGSIISNPELHHIYLVSDSDRWIGTFIIQPENQYLSHFHLGQDDAQNGNKIFYAIKQVCNNIRINNIDDTLKNQLAVVQEVGLENHINQYLMEMTL